MKNFGDMLLQSSPIFLVMTAPDGSLRMVSDSLLKALEYTVDEVAGQGMAERLVAESSRVRTRILLRKCLETGKGSSGELLLASRSGTMIPAEWQFHPVYRESGELDFLFGTGLDITSLKNPESRLRESEEPYRAFFHGSHTPMLLVSPGTGDILDANAAACRFYGYSPGKIIQLRIADIDTLPPDRVLCELERAARGERADHVFRHRLADGTVRDVEVSSGGIVIAGTPLLYFMIHDITERKRMEDELMREREEQALMFDSVPAMIFYKNRRNRFIRVNQAFSDMLGKPRKSIEGATVEEIFPEIAERSGKDDREVIESGRPKRGILDILETSSGIRWIRTDKVPFRDERGEIIGILGFSTDITEPKGAGEAIKALLETAIGSDEPDLFDRMTIRIREWLGAESALVFRTSERPWAEALTMDVDGRRLPCFSFRLEDTLFAEVLERGYVFCPEGSGSISPRSVETAGFPIEGFAGIAIRDRSGAPAGAICVLSHRKLILPNRAEEVLRIFAEKGALELERIRSQAALRESEERYRSLVETSPDAIAMFDLEGRIITANPRFAKLIGSGDVDRVASSGWKAFDFLSEADIPRATRYARGLLDNEILRSSDVFMVHSFDGVVFPAEINSSLVRDDHGAPRAFIAIVRNISERVEAERKLQQEHIMLEMRLSNERMLSSIASIMASAETLDGVFARIARIIRETLSITRVCLVRCGSECGKPDDTPQFEALFGPDRPCRAFFQSGRLRAVLTDRRPALLNDLSSLEPEIREIFLSASIRSFTLFPLSAGHAVKGLIAFGRDTEYPWLPEETDLFGIIADMIANAIERDDNFRARIEAERRHAEATRIAERSSRLASVGTLAAGISHEINQPLTALKVKVDSMLYWGEIGAGLNQGDMEQDLRFIAQQIERIDDIIKHMRALARQEKGGEPGPVNLNQVVDDVLPLLRQQISAHGIQIVQSLDRKLPPIRGHRTLLQQVVINLVVNAIHAHDEHEKSPKAIIITTGRLESGCYLEVVDNGPGIAEAHLNQIFDPFFTTRIGSDGMGLGLSICHNIVTGLGGVITAENVPGGGARFLVTIPAIPDGGQRNEHPAG